MQQAWDADEQADLEAMTWPEFREENPERSRFNAESDVIRCHRSLLPSSLSRNCSASASRASRSDGRQ